MAQHDVSCLQEELATLVASGAAGTLVNRPLREPTELSNVASKSYAHPNGFRKIVVAKTDSGATLRVHHWPSGDEGGSNVHNHRWAFSSVIIAGRNRSALFTLADADSGALVERYRFESGQAGREYGLVAVGQDRLAATSTDEFGPGSIYGLRAEQLHQVCCDPGTISLVLTGPLERDHTDVFRSIGLEAQPLHLAPLRRFEVCESLELAQAKVKTLQGGRSL